MGVMDARNMYSNLAVNKYLHTLAYCWISSAYYNYSCWMYSTFDVFSQMLFAIPDNTLHFVINQMKNEFGEIWFCLPTNKRGVGYILVMVVTNILDIVHCPRLKFHSILEAGCACVFKRNGERKEPGQVGAEESDSLNLWTEGWKLACSEFLMWDDGQGLKFKS